MDLGLITFGSLLPDAYTGVAVSQHARIREVVEGARTAEELGYSWYTIGEHHFGERDTIPAPALVLAAAAEHTSTIRLATGTTLVANRDAVLVAEEYALLDQLSGGRLELVAGGSFFPEPYAVFGQDPDSRSARKREGVDLLLRLWNEDRVDWSGEYRPPLDGVRVEPRIHQDRPPVWVSGGSRPDSIQLAVEHGLPIVFGTTAGNPHDWAAATRSYRDLWAEHRSGPVPRIGAASHAFVARTSQEARERWAEYFGSYLSARIPRHEQDFEGRIGPDGPSLCGSPAEVLDKLGRLHELWGHDLHLLAVDIGGIPQAEVTAAAELIAAEVLPHLPASAPVAAGARA
ncbi:LLM class flavin-dependent oxidoreductase [Pseudonocardia endophytica]|uniref:Alkanesulfonate monooxygenase SsuD/methylene tetrahydromethanopterin reductase-like flavin-dependent oxidoreductase (Luciferase family) n=1 Tax=Pseudonocardia endophytica TaxID=401976 RepID=A0A4R1HLT7_PSEEN|nr:LLM class flavin-dependent oxidoreductase [Pseudonocardia endophytica]TCK22071.1 alkanesulfonate monooxygenase SsuD/methylene tetrahydromethanopterin reductase-like flavin-dependent oxidoreductase (luciferase family) [Pseudonocardia endophytica]